MSRLIEYIPSYEINSRMFQEIVNTEQIEFDNLNIAIEDLDKQLSIDTATWGLVIYEKELGIRTLLNKPLEERRSVIKSKWRGTGKVDRALIKAVVDAYTNGGVDVEFDGTIKVIFNDILGRPENMQDVYNAVGEISPAHLRIIYEYLYRTYNELTQYTHGYLSGYTHLELREGEI